MLRSRSSPKKEHMSVKEVAQLWARLQFFPIEMIAACEGKSVKSLLAESTGLSPAHLSTSGLVVKSAKKLDQVGFHVQAHAQKSLKSKGYSDDEVRQQIAACPDTALAGLAYRLGQAGSEPLQLAMDFGARLDRLTLRAIHCAKTYDLQNYQGLVVEFLEEERNASRVEESRQEVGLLQQQVLAATDWADLQKPTDQLLQYLLLAMLAAVDVEWGARYFRRLSPTPTFFWMTPRFHPEFDETNSKGLKRDVVARPVGKLLELLWAVTKRAASKQNEWPSEPPGPSLLARDIAHVPTSDGVIRKWSSGAKPLRFDQATELWVSLHASLSGGQAFEVPLPWIAVALWMERALIRPMPKSSKAGTVVILSDSAYQHIWVAHRERWATHLPKPGNLPWPEWLLAQSSWPE